MDGAVCPVAWAPDGDVSPGLLDQGEGFALVFAHRSLPGLYFAPANPVARVDEGEVGIAGGGSLAVVRVVDPPAEYPRESNHLPLELLLSPPLDLSGLSFSSRGYC